MDDLDTMSDGTIARIPCAANIPCGDLQNILAYPRGVGRRKTPISGEERSIGAEIRKARERLDVSVADLGLAMGKTRQAAQFWERGENLPTLSDFPKLCRLLRSDPNTLLGIDSMPAMTEEEKQASQRKIQLAAEAARAAKRGPARRRAASERLHPRSASASGIRR
jgi:transcriptional regulator with XRE-family HTH domain